MLRKFLKVNLISALAFSSILSAPIVSQATTTTLPTDFESVPNYAKDTIALLYQTGKLAGFEGGKFKPLNSVTRTEFYAMVLKNTEFEDVKESTPFADITTKFQQTVMDKAYKKGLLSGSSYNEKGELVVKPNAPITRQEMAAILVRAYGKKYSNSSNINGDDIIFSYSDVNDISGWASPAVYDALALGLIAGTSKDKISPKGVGTRTEAAILAHRLENLMNAAPLVIEYSDGQSLSDAIDEYDSLHQAQSLYFRLFNSKTNVPLDAPLEELFNNTSSEYIENEDGTITETPPLDKTTTGEPVYDAYFVIKTTTTNGEEKLFSVDTFNYTESVFDSEDNLIEYSPEMASYYASSKIDLNTLFEFIKSKDNTVTLETYEISEIAPTSAYNTPINDSHRVIYYNGNYEAQGEMTLSKK